MYHFLVPVDTDINRERVEIEYVLHLPLDPTEVRVTVAHAYMDTKRTDDPIERPESVRDALARLRDAGYTARHEEISGNPSDGIPMLADDLEVDEIVMAGRERNPTQKAIFGSATQSVILNTNRPVTVLSA